MRRALPVLTLVMLASCVPAPRPAPPPAPASVPVPAPAPPPVALAPDWNDWPRTPGTWRYAANDATSSATFVGSRPAMLVCVRPSRSLVLSFGAGGTGPATIRTSSMTRQLATSVSSDPVARTSVSLAATDPLLDAIAFSRGRFTVEQAGIAPLVLPPYAEIDRVIEDCRG